MVEKSKPRKKHPKISAEPVVRKKHGLVEVEKKKNYGWVVAGFDVSMSSIAGAAMCYDAVLDQMKGPGFVIRRWSKQDHYFDRLRTAAMGHELIWDLLGELRLGNMPLEKIFIAQEEPFPPHSKFIMKGQSHTLKQQAEISGAFLGGLLRYGYENIWQIHNQTWRKVIADDLGITTHYSKWRDPSLVEVYNCKPQDTGKFRSKQWALSSPGPGYAFMHALSEEIPDFPDIIESSKDGKIPRPEGSVARAVQPDDRYDALAMMWAQYQELEDSGILYEEKE